MNTEKTDKPSGPSMAFLKKVYTKLKELVGDKVSQEDFNAAVSHARAHAGGMAKAEKNKTAGEQSLTDIIEQVNAALTNAFRTTFDRQSIFYYAKEVYANRVIACSSVDGKVYEIPYIINADGDVEFGDPVEVEETYTPVGMNELSSLCAKGHGSRLFMEHRFATPPEWMPLLPKPGEFKHPVYGEIVITKERNGHFVENFQAGVYQERLPVDAEHETKLSGAVGWITEMRVNDDGSADAKVEWTPRGVTLIEADSFKYVSPEWYDSWTAPDTGETHEDIAIGAALTTRPFFKEGSLRPLVANEQGLYAPDAEKSAPQTYYFTALAPATEEKRTMAEDKPDGAQQFAEIQGKVTALEAELAATKQASETQATQLTSLNERNATLEKEGRTRRFTDLIKTGKWLGKPESHLKFMEKFGEGTEEFNDYVTEQNAVAEQAKTAGLFTEIGSGQSGDAGGSADAQLDAKVRALREKEPALSVGDAYSVVCRENPTLYEQSRAASSVRV
jgi:hypothetical protein